MAEKLTCIFITSNFEALELSERSLRFPTTLLGGFHGPIGWKIHWNIVQENQEESI